MCVAHHTSLYRANVKSSFMTAVIFAIAQGSIFFIFAGGFSMGAFIVQSDPSEVYYADYDNIFRYVVIVVSSTTFQFLLEFFQLLCLLLSPLGGPVPLLLMLKRPKFLPVVF